MRMLDFVKAITENQKLIAKLHRLAESKLQSHRPQNNYYLAYSNGSGRFRIEFRKVISEGQLIGFRNAELCFSPHYLFNQDRHNGNDFAPIDCIEVIKSVLNAIGVSKSDLKEFSVSKLDYALNLKADHVPEIVNGIIYHKRTPFQVGSFPNFKVSANTKQKYLKAYDKGIQFPSFGIGEVFRFEVVLKARRNIQKLGIADLSDLLKIEKYDALFQSIIDEWEHILIINKKLNSKENTPEFWQRKLNVKYRNSFAREKQKYYQNLASEHHLHRSIKMKMIDKICDLSEGANTPQRTPINRDFFKNGIFAPY